MEIKLIEELQNHISKLENEISDLKAKLNLANRDIINKDLHIGKISAERIRTIGDLKLARAELEKIPELYVDRRLFNDRINVLVDLLVKMRKKSENAEERQLFQEFIEVLIKVDEHKKKTK